MAIYKLQGIVVVLSRYRSTSLSSSRRANLIEENRSSSFVNGFRHLYPGHLQGQVLSRSHIPMAKNGNVYGDTDDRSSMPSRFEESANDGKQPPPSPPSRPKPWISIWVKWAAGSILSLLLSMWMPNWSTLLKIGGEAEFVLKESEKMAEAVEKVATISGGPSTPVGAWAPTGPYVGPPLATMAEKVAEDVADQLPDNTKLKEAAKLVENISKEAAKDAHLADQIIHKVDSVEHDLEELETLVEPFINKIIHEIDHDKKT